MVRFTVYKFNLDVIFRISYYRRFPNMGQQKTSYVRLKLAKMNSLVSLKKRKKVITL